MIEASAETGLSLRSRVAPLSVIGQALRVRQWTKNLLLFAGLLFAARLGDPGRWAEAWVAFAAYCAGSSAAYLVNDVHDLERDRLHPAKRRRPVASGRVSPWLLACTALLALFLALAKRRGELGLQGSEDGRSRAVLARYSIPVVERMLVALAVATVCAYTAYSLSARDSLEMVVTVPFVVAAIVRYLILVRRHGLGEEPEEILLRDAPILLAIAGWAVTAALVLSLS